MTIKTKKVAAALGASTTPKKSTSKPMKKAFDFEKLQNLVKQRQVCAAHLQRLNDCADDPEFLEELKTPNDQENASEIVLRFGNSHHSPTYTIKNVVLIDEVRNFLHSKIEARKVDIETEIESFG